MTVTPEDNKIIVFNNGTLKGLNGLSPIGGHWLPNSAVGARLLWKKAQKKDKKKKTSETINNTMPQRNPSSTMAECKPCILPSREMSRHHWAITIKMINSPPNIKESEFI